MGIQIENSTDEKTRSYKFIAKSKRTTK